MDFACQSICSQVRRQPESVLGLATGNTMIPLYARLVEEHRRGLDCSRVRTFNLDEYVGLSPDHPSSYAHYMNEHFFEHVALADSQLPRGLATNLEEHCLEYEQAIAQAGGIDLQLLGLGQNGHIGFNEPTSSLSSNTRVRTLTQSTRQANQGGFASHERVPAQVITMGVATILKARQCLLLAYGASKARAVAAMIEGPVTSMCPASVLQFHAQCTVVVDEAAASQLTLRDYFLECEANSEAGPQGLRQDLDENRRRP